MAIPPIRKTTPERPGNRNFIFLAAAVLIVGFLFIIGLFFVLSSFAPIVVGKCVGVMNLDQEITTTSSPGGLLSSGVIGSEDYATAISALDKRSDIGALVLVVNSPGGSVVATREIYDAYKELKMPKVSYFREVAASGGYYVGSGGDYIISDPDALTGSIGVIATFADLSELFSKIGLNITPIKSGPHKDIGAEFRALTPEEHIILQSVVDEIYTEFKNTVVQNRGSKLNAALFANSTDGRVMSGRQAVRAGLVDQVGTKKDAIMKAADLANITYSSYDEIKICNVDVSSGSSGLFGVSSIIGKIGLDVPRQSYSVQYK
ncbi:signal peptide peptidase SppA [Candidatus Micrarchaeota archaeon]|nr:signal peptide peptidase SppA [Candidatus Micrarchaeota archaeon]